jgi:hypothetical protein
MHEDELLGRVRELFRASLDIRFAGGAHHQQTRAQGYLDGYMRALSDAGLVDAQTLLRVIGGERRRDATRVAPEAEHAAVDAA